jgi:hypothetical protein
MTIFRAQAVSAWSFVRITAWSMIALAALTMLLSVPQGMLGMLLTDEVLAPMLEAPELRGMPAAFFWYFRHFVAIAVFSFVLGLLTLFAGWGMLKRRRWALWFSIAMFWVGAAGNIVGIGAHAIMLHDLHAGAAELMPPLREMVQSDFWYWSSQISGVAFGLLFAVGFGWTAWKLGRPETRAEFPAA